jgi:hypothetical protein
MKAQDRGDSPTTATARARAGVKRRKRDEFAQFCAEKALTDKEKAALPPALRQLLGWE